MLIASFIIGNGLEEQARWGRGEVGGERSTRREEEEWACLVRCGCLPRVGRRVQTLPSQHPGSNVQVHFSLRKAWGSGGLLTSYISVSFLENSADCVRRTLTWWILGLRAGPFHHRTCYPGSGRVIMAPVLASLGIPQTWRATYSRSFHFSDPYLRSDQCGRIKVSLN